MSAQDYYVVLGVHPSASPGDIRRAFRQLAIRYHPDVNRSPGALARFQEINTAYQVLNDPARRARYDSTRRIGTSRPTPASAASGPPDVRLYYFQRRARAMFNPNANWSYYDVLGVPYNATPDTILRAYHRLYQEFYLERSPGQETAAILREITGAGQILNDPVSRAAYDRLPLDRRPPGRPLTHQQPQRPSPPRPGASSNPPGRPRPQPGSRPSAGCLVAVLLVPLLALAAVGRWLASALR